MMTSGGDSWQNLALSRLSLQYQTDLLVARQSTFSPNQLSTVIWVSSAKSYNKCDLGTETLISI